ncbi:hypothetical protein [Bifidobacterium callimiconis]|uniref:Uncharacterized protein n=1 Tax=Bifidobacterium callimiconis TaxID=2306973 RepID=A0A430FDJ1_9BIFI|nr:hypothetical protein [Bifidobacterium callimiconis]RSX50887.1 hypothetical protein D2E23_1178 [Bifidobacterium callimiconis]
MSQDMPFGVGWSLLAGTVVFVVAAILTDRNRFNKSWIRIGLLTAVIVFCVLFASTTFFHWSYSRFDFWNKLISIVATVQFPWRLLGVASMLLVFISCIGIFVLKTNGGYRTLYMSVVASLIALCVIECGVATTTWMQNTEPVGDISSSEFKPTGNYGVMSGEYLPSKSDVGTLIANQEKYPSSKNVSISTYEKNGGKVYMMVTSASSGAEVTVPLLMYPHYVVQAEKDSSAFRLSANQDGVMVLHIPNGYRGSVTIHFIEPISWRIGEIISVVSSLVMVGVVIFCRKRAA